MAVPFAVRCEEFIDQMVINDTDKETCYLKKNVEEQLVVYSLHEVLGAVKHSQLKGSDWSFQHKYFI